MIIDHHPSVPPQGGRRRGIKAPCTPSRAIVGSHRSTDEPAYPWFAAETYPCKRRVRELNKNLKQKTPNPCQGRSKTPWYHPAYEPKHITRRRNNGRTRHQLLGRSCSLMGHKRASWALGVALHQPATLCKNALNTPANQILI